jgi:hypothetical protein
MTNDERKIKMENQETINKIEIDESDLGVWFGIDGKAINTQEQLDLAVIALAGLYGKRSASLSELKQVHSVVYEDDPEISRDLFIALSLKADRAVKYLNQILPEGYEFDFEGMDYSQFTLRRTLV